MQWHDESIKALCLIVRNIPFLAYQNSTQRPGSGRYYTEMVYFSVLWMLQYIAYLPGPKKI